MIIFSCYCSSPCGLHILFDEPTHPTNQTANNEPTGWLTNQSITLWNGDTVLHSVPATSQHSMGYARPKTRDRSHLLQLLHAVAFHPVQNTTKGCTVSWFAFGLLFYKLVLEYVLEYPYSKSSTTVHDMHNRRQQTLRVATTTMRVSCLQLTSHHTSA